MEGLRCAKKTPSVYFVFALAVAVLVHFFDPLRGSRDAPYTGETKMSIFFPGDGSEPKTVTKSNIYRASTMGVETQFMGPKSDKEINVAKSRVWIVELLFDKEIDAENMNLVGGGLDSNVRVGLREFSRRSATLVIVPTEPLNQSNPTSPINPKGVLEIRTERRAVTYPPDNSTRPSPIPRKEASPH